MGKWMHLGSDVKDIKWVLHREKDECIPKNNKMIEEESNLQDDMQVLIRRTRHRAERKSKVKISLGGTRGNDREETKLL